MNNPDTPVRDIREYFQIVTSGEEFNPMRLKNE